MREFHNESLIHDPIHGYIPITASTEPDLPGEVTERELIDHPWVQRQRQIHQLQTAWWVFPSAEHTRFQHVIGSMHLAGRAVAGLYDSLQDVCDDTPSLPYVESLMRVAALLHDVGHGPFGHFFDAHFLTEFGLTHETLGGLIIRHELGDLLRRIRRSPSGRLRDEERLDPDQIAWLIARPGSRLPAGEDHGSPADTDRPRWLRMLRSLLCGIYTVDNMDFVLRDAYMSGYSLQAFDLDRLLHHSFFSEQGLTIHDRGIGALVRFMGARAELFRTVYFHRTVRAIDLTLADLFRESKKLLFPGNPAEHLDRYRELTEWTLLVDVARWHRSEDPRRRELGRRWQQLLARQIPWQSVCQRNLIFDENDAELSSIFSDPEMVEHALRKKLPASLAEMPLQVDVARHIYRPHVRRPADDLNFLYDSARQCVRPLTANQLFHRLPVSHRICRLYARSAEHAAELASALDALIGPGGVDDLTNM